ncbi:hypothetical protein AGDE_13067 [Angomonas deanei]|nr:hypothetical protein AGDE_13067 [Angomonas deanei]|eukprot:EPY22874.1 hypothetical protein AGDE_13067 [Angomonas deanei]
MKDYYLKTFFPDSLASLGVHHFATAQFVKQVREENNTFVIAVDDVRLSPVVEVGSKVYVNLGATDTFIGSTVGGVVTKVNSNGTLGVLFDNNDYVLQLPQEKVSLSTGRSRFTLTEDYKKMLVWMKDAGVKRHGDLERLCIVLYARGGVRRICTCWKEPTSTAWCT